VRSIALPNTNLIPIASNKKKQGKPENKHKPRIWLKISLKPYLAISTRIVKKNFMFYIGLA
jgi:hypothetical protein